jgi:hypothetical protein
MPTKTQREREAEQRKQKLDRIQEQVEEGSLVIRKMTKAEREQFEARREERAESADPRDRKRAASAERAKNRARARARTKH